jgi:hypothetical protein
MDHGKAQNYNNFNKKNLQIWRFPGFDYFGKRWHFLFLIK